MANTWKRTDTYPINNRIITFFICIFNEKSISLQPLTRSGCSSARLEYTSGGRVAAGSNPVTPTKRVRIKIRTLFLFNSYLFLFSPDIKYFYSLYTNILRILPLFTFKILSFKDQLTNLQIQLLNIYLNSV